MKPHLPKLLYTALLAVIFPAAAHAEPASYGKLISAEQVTVIADGSNVIGYPINHTSVPDATAKDWVLTLTGTDITPPETDISAARTAELLIIGTSTMVVENDEKWKVTPADDSLQITIAPDGDLFVALETKGNRNSTYILNNIKNYKWNHVDEITITLAYDADEKRLSLEGGSIRRSTTGAAQQIGSISDLNFNVKESFFTIDSTSIHHPHFSSGAGGTLVSTLVSESGEDGWKITGNTSIQDLLGGTYSDRALQSSDKVQFVGIHGILYTDSDYTFENTITVSADLTALKEGTAISFGAAAGKVLTVTQGTNSINDIQANALVDTLNIVGEGTVKLCYSGTNTANLTAVQVRVADSATLEIDDTGTQTSVSTQIALHRGEFSENASIVKSGKKTDLLLQTGEAATRLKQVTNTNGNLNITGGGLLQVQNLTATDGGISIDADTISTGEVTAANKVNVTSTTEALLHNINAGGLEVSAGGKLVATGSAVVTGAVQLGGTAQMNTLKADNITVAGNGVLESASLTANSVAAGGISASSGSPDSPVFSNGVLLDKTGISAGSMTNVSLQVGGTQVLDSASTGKAISMSGSGIKATGTLTASEVRLAPEYTISATRLEADKVSVVGSATNFTNATLTGVRSLSGTAAAIDSMEADSIILANGYQLASGAIEATSLSIGTNAAVRDATISNTLVTAGSGASLNNVKLGEGTTLRSTQMNMRDLVVRHAFGGASGQAFRKGGNIDSLVLTGNTAENDISLSYVVLNGEALDFSGSSSENQKEHPVLLTDGSISYDASTSNYELYIQSYTRAELKVEGSALIIRGYQDEAGIKNEMTNTANRKATIAALDAVENSGEAAVLKSYVGHVNRYTLADRTQVLDAVSGASTAALADSQRRGIQNVQATLRNRVIQTGGGTNAGLTTDWEYVGLQAWAQADGSFAASDGSGDECGYDFNTWGATVGANLDLTAHTVLGVAFSASYGEIESDGADHASGNNDAQYLSIFARHQHNHWVQMLILSAGFNDMNLERSVLGYAAKGDTKGSSLSAYYELGYTVGLNYEYTHILQPMVSISLTSASVDAYSESGSLGNAALKYDGDSYLYGKIGLGARYQGVLYETVHERSAVIEARALITQDFGDTTETAVVAIGNGPLHEVNGADTSGTGFELGVGVSIPVEQHTTLYADADLNVTPDYTGFRANAGVRYDF